MLRETLHRKNTAGIKRFLAVFFVLNLFGCHSCLKRVPDESVHVGEYPTCGEKPVPLKGELVLEGVLRSGPGMRDQNVFEEYRIEKRNCVYVATVRLEWPQGVSDVEAVYDLNWKPIWIWKRMTLPGVDEDGRPDIRVYDLRGDKPTMAWKASGEEVTKWWLRSEGEVHAAIGPGRGLLYPWIQHEKLNEGGIARRQVLDVRDLVENVDEVALKYVGIEKIAEMGDTRVFTILGREAFFVDEEMKPIGDLLGLREESLLNTPRPKRLPQYDEIDPRRPLR